MSSPGMFCQFQCVARNPSPSGSQGLSLRWALMLLDIVFTPAMWGASLGALCGAEASCQEGSPCAQWRQMASSIPDICLTCSHHTSNFVILKLPNLSLICVCMLCPMCGICMWRSLYWCRGMSFLHDMCMHAICVCFCYSWYGASGLCIICMCLCVCGREYLCLSWCMSWCDVCLCMYMWCIEACVVRCFCFLVGILAACFSMP